MNLAATGHRPDKLGGYGDWVFTRLVHLAETYLKSRPEILKHDITVISGMALGWDTAWATAALNLKLPLIAAVPFFGQESQWPEQSQARYLNILDKAEHVEIVCEGGYDPSKMQIRNEWMVDQCNELVALWDGSKGGTYNCIKYAKKVKKPIINLWDMYES